MSRMIPPFLDDSVTSNGEKKLFDELKKLSDDFVILHSLGIASHREKVFGEIDFVIICRYGVLCLEVKGGHVHRKEGVWCFTDRYGQEHKKIEGPFQQVMVAMSSLRDYINKRFGPDDAVSRCLYACGMAFPDIPFTAKGPDIIPEIIFDFRSLYEDISDYILSTFDYWRTQLKEKHGFALNNLSKGDIDKLTCYLRGDFGFIPSLCDIIEETDNRILTLTMEQAERLAMASDNPRILLKGTAGTGKTLLSLEHARREVSTGKKVLYLCFNRNLNRYLNMQDMPNKCEFLHIDTFHNYLTSSLEENYCLPAFDGQAYDEYFQWILPEAFLDMVNSIVYEPQYDALIVDEGQDLLREVYLACMDAMVKGGLANGDWHICFDPNQNIYNSDFTSGLKAIEAYRPVILQLDTNCRNTLQIGTYNKKVTGLPSAKYFSTTGQQVVTESYSDLDCQRNQVIKAVKSLLAQGISPGKICLLSKYRYENSCLQGENIFKSICKFQNITDIDPKLILEDSLKFCTIHSFKGLEAPIIFLLDVKNFADATARILNYTAISRARILLYIFYNKDAQEELNGLSFSSYDLT